MAGIIQRVKGVRDILPAESRIWRYMEETIHHVMALYGYELIRTPVFEPTELFSRSVGEETDIVHKEMYTFTDQGGKSLTLRPELTASVVRAYIQNNLARETPISRFYYIGSLFRQERPQKGRLRQFHQFGCEAFGSSHPEQDVEVLAIAYQISSRFVKADLAVRLNTLGSFESRRPYLAKLRESLEPVKNKLTGLDQRRLETNPLRLFDSKDPETQAILQDRAPIISDHVSPEDREHFEAVKAGLDVLAIPYVHDPTMVRGLDYYTRTTFEITSGSLGAQDALLGGGRYDGLVNQLGGGPVPGTGFAAGMERLLMAAGDAFENELARQEPFAYLVVLGDNARQAAIGLATRVRDAGIPVVMETLRRSPKAQFREAGRSGAAVTLVLGDDEVANGTVTLKDMATGQQETVPLSDAPQKLRAHLNR